MKRAMLALLVLLAWASPAAAQDPEDVAARVSQEIMSPFCDGVTLHDCPSQAADELRARITTMARSGMTQEQIISTLEEEYGDRIRATPRSPLAWIVPALAVIAGLAALTLLARRWTHRARPAAASGISDHDRARLESELATHRGRP